MAYESKVIIARKQGTYYDQIAILDLCSMGDDTGWRELFDKEIEEKILFEGKFCKYDCYGDVLKYATIQEVLNWCYFIADAEIRKYRRFKMLEAFLYHLYVNQDWDNLVIIHYGY